MGGGGSGGSGCDCEKRTPAHLEVHVLKEVRRAVILVRLIPAASVNVHTYSSSVAMSALSCHSNEGR
jgi:hypothetical protein